MCKDQTLQERNVKPTVQIAHKYEQLLQQDHYGPFKLRRSVWINIVLIDQQLVYRPIYIVPDRCTTGFKV